MESADTEELRLFYGGMAYTHDENGSPLPGRHNSGVGLATLRKDGFVSINAPRVFNVPVEQLPMFTTIPLTVPGGSTGRWQCDPGAPFVLQANVETSVSRLVFIEVLDPVVDRVLPGMGIGDADPIRGNFLHKNVSWRSNTSWGDDLRGSFVALRVWMTDAKLYSLTWACNGQR